MCKENNYLLSDAISFQESRQFFGHFLINCQLTGSFWVFILAIFDHFLAIWTNFGIHISSNFILIVLCDSIPSKISWPTLLCHAHLRRSQSSQSFTSTYHPLSHHPPPFCSMSSCKSSCSPMPQNPSPSNGKPTARNLIGILIIIIRDNLWLFVILRTAKFLLVRGSWWFSWHNLEEWTSGNCKWLCGKLISGNSVSLHTFHSLEPPGTAAAAKRDFPHCLRPSPPLPVGVARLLQGELEGGVALLPGRECLQQRVERGG